MRTPTSVATNADYCAFLFLLLPLLGLSVPLPIPVALLPASAAPCTAPFAAPAAAPATTLPTTFFTLLIIPGPERALRDFLPARFLLVATELALVAADRFFEDCLADFFFVVFLVAIFAPNREWFDSPWWRRLSGATPGLLVCVRTLTARLREPYS